MSAVTVIAGSGPSLAAIAPGRVLADDLIVRVNNFFFEDRYYLGARVDLAFVSGDPRLAPFLCATLRRARADYDIRAWTAPSRRVERAGRRRLRLPFRPFCPGDAETAARVEALKARYQAIPSSGVQAVLMAQHMGAARIVLAGIDLYSGAKRYVYTPGRHQRALLGQDLDTRAYDRPLHHPDLDRAVLAWLADRPGLTLWRSADCAALNDLLDLAPARPGAAPVPAPKRRIADWDARAGLYPIALLKLMRRMRRWQRHLTGDFR
ncbi:hypothetical protein [Pseudoruegeria sp. HB172150]|uniref:hypothetical protein n=1 Tax=Pseudoruegeria sp. HB172150 TaxID=2721164 RepID=UPI001554D895|nr:hypothetical protein [Pseudoruegeria sp. HB172150]